MSTCDTEEVDILKKQDIKYPLHVTYCGICSMPLEYCSYSPVFDQCKKWLEKNNPDIYANMYTSYIQNITGDDIIDKIANFGLNSDDDAKKRQTRGGKVNTVAKLAGVAKGKINPQSTFIKIFNAPRGKKKSVTVIQGLEDFGVDMKAASKFFATKFSCGASVTSPNEIVIQGDVKDDVIDVISEKWAEQIPSQSIKDLGIMKR